MRRIILFNLLMGLCLIMGKSPSNAQIAVSYLTPHENIFGIVEGVWYPELTCELGLGWERLIFNWADHQPNNTDEFVGFLNIPDEWLVYASDCNREVVAVVKNTPAWATDGSPNSGVPRGLYLPVDDPNNLWANFMRKVGAYYASRGVNRFIIWNEPDIAPGVYGFEFEGTLEDYFQMVKVAYLAVKQGNPAARIHLAGTTYWHDVNRGERLFTDQLLERIKNDTDGEKYHYYFDTLSLHIYFRTDTVYDLVKLYRGLLNQYGFTDKQIWVTETNASPNLDPNWMVNRPQFQITLQHQANFLIQSASQALAAGATRIAVYKLYDQFLPQGAESFGILSPADGTPRPAFYSWKVVSQYLNGVYETHFARNDRTNVVQLYHLNEMQTIVTWARTAQAATLEISATSDKAYLVNNQGDMVAIRPENGIYRLILAGANCEPPPEGCVVGGDVWLFIQPIGATTITEITPNNRYLLLPIE